ncbi:response regulator transcription factor [Abyssisolibacter fermentans]|uniref:response regulator transcription factor n=1 Tax=Abyssisolibacter fermentans TaxID=1766203 RepID=UPI00082B4DED|nr:response regulator transcription factor [Abyssisolibacter fermentans]
MQNTIYDKKILLVDDELELLLLLETVLKKEGFTNIYKVTNGEKAVEMTKKVSPDIIILDIMLPDIDGFEVCKKIRDFSYVPIIFLSAKSEDFDKYFAFRIGADDYVTKPFSPKEVALRVVANLKRNTYVKEKSKYNILSFDEISIDINRGTVTKNNSEIRLTPTEYKLLVYMAQNHDYILSKNLICLNVWGTDFEGYDNTIMVHMRKLRTKLENDPSNPKIIKTVKGMGYKFSTQELGN